MDGASDFDDDEDFGLGAPAVPEPGSVVEPPASERSLPQQEEDEEDDIYGDIADKTALVPVDGESTPADSTLGTEQQVLNAERENSGQLAESRVRTEHKTSTVGNKPGSKPQLPKRLADTTVVYVGELQWWTTDADLENLCRDFGPISAITFFEEKGSGKSKGYALVKFTTKEAANLCRQQMHGMEINGRCFLRTSLEHSRKCVVTFSSNSNAASAAAKGGGRQDSKPTPSSGVPVAAGKGPPPPGPGRAWGGRGSWGAPPMRSMPMPPMPPWTGGPAMGMGGLPMPGVGTGWLFRDAIMPGMGVPPFMGMMEPGARGDGREFKRTRF